AGLPLIIEAPLLVLVVLVPFVLRRRLALPLDHARVGGAGLDGPVGAQQLDPELPLVAVVEAEEELLLPPCARPGHVADADPGGVTRRLGREAAAPREQGLPAVPAGPGRSRPLLIVRPSGRSRPLRGLRQHPERDARATLALRGDVRT